MQSLLKVLLFIMGCLLLGWAVSTVDMASVATLLKKLGGGFFIIFLIYAGVTWLDTMSWKCNFRPQEAKLISNGNLWRIRQIGEAYNVITPFATLGGEPVKAQLLKENQGLSLKQGASSLIIAKTTFLVGLILFFIPGIFMIMKSSEIPGEFKTISLVGMTIFSTSILLFFVFQITGTLGKVCAWLGQKINNPGLKKTLYELEHLNELFSSFYGKFSARVVKAVILAFLGWVVGLAEMYVTLHFLGFSVSLYELWIMEAMAQLVKIGSFMIPLSLGAQEGGLILIFTALGYPANLGLTVSLVRRIRELVWVGLGLALGGKMALKPATSPGASEQ